MITDIHDAITSLSAHGKELPVGLTQQMRDEIDSLVRQGGGGDGAPYSSTLRGMGIAAAGEQHMARRCLWGSCDAHSR